MNVLRGLIVNATGPVGALAREALCDHALMTLDAAGTDEAGWEAFCSRCAEQGLLFDTIVHCPIEAPGPEGVEREILSAWLTAKFALRLAAPGEPALLTVTREGFGPVAIDADAAGNAIRIATCAAMLDGSKAGIRLRSNRLALSPEAASEPAIAAIRALTDRRASFLAGADVSLAPTAQTGAELSLAGKTVLVTGATSGIGRASAIEIGRLGGYVLVGGRKPDLARETLDLVREVGGDGEFLALDVTDASAWAAVAERIARRGGALHGLVNNAGEARNQPIGELHEDVPRFLNHLNYGACRLGMDSLLDELAAGEGAIVNVASVAGMRAGFAGSAYGGSKAAMIGLSQSYARAVAAPRGVRVNAIQPGLIWSDSVIDALGEEGARAFRDMIEGKTPIGRVGAPDEIGRFVAYLLSDAARGISGQAIPVSGGLELVHP